ncbi:MAG: hypothetical protein ABL914_12430 [Novosphingobium sp.]|uniref:hypothetical protein n=1 Tax=Novosphingobium sp. TaxID=1874826 RepID=UPI0032BB56A7
MNQPTLPAIAALARAGAIARAWELFVAGGHADRADDPAALAVKGRLTKGQARLAAGADQRRLFADAAAAYGAADALSPAPYLAINAATLHLLAGDPVAAAQRARGVLAQLDAPTTPADTPYFLSATRAESLLILGDQDEAKAAMARAAAEQIDGWADRAATIAQLREIAAAQGSDPGWIDRFAAPASLHFAGHMGIAAGQSSELALTDAVDRLLSQTGIGFAWGALAAGADLIIAERLLGRGVELHGVLPCPPDQFEAQSVAPAGQIWADRYRAVLAQIASLRVAADSAVSVHDPLATRHAGELAIGGALNNAATLSSSACQLIVTDDLGGGANTRRQADLWRAAAGPQHHLIVPRDCAVEAMFPPEQPDPARILAVHLAIGLDALSASRARGSHEIAAMTAPVVAAMANIPPGSVRTAPGLWEAVIEDLPLALDTITRLAALGNVAIGADLEIAPVLYDPPSATMIPYGCAAPRARQLMALAPTGVALASDALAVTLAAHGLGQLRSELYHPGDDQGEVAIHALVS